MHGEDNINMMAHDRTTGLVIVKGRLFAVGVRGVREVKPFRIGRRFGMRGDIIFSTP